MQPFIPRKSINENILDTIMFVPDGLRKELRLLAKQYQILELSQEPILEEEYNGMSITIKENPYIIKYREFGGSEVFEWIIELERTRSWQK